MKCKACGCFLSEAFGNKIIKYRQYYLEHLKCIMCGRFYSKKELYGLEVINPAAPEEKEDGLLTR